MHCSPYLHLLIFNELTLNNAMKKKTKRNLIIVVTLIVLIGAGVAWFVYPFVRYSSHILAYRSTLPENACYQSSIQYSKEGWFLIDCIINGTHKVPLRIDTQATSLMREDSIHTYNGEYWGICRLKVPMRIKKNTLLSCTHLLPFLLVRQASKNRCLIVSVRII